MLFTLLTVLFIGLKLTGYIDWNWLLVASPLLVHFLLVFCVEFYKNMKETK